MTDVVIITGSPGSGKSTVARLLAQQYPLCALLHTDDFWHHIVRGGIAPYLPEADEQNQTVVGVIASTAFGYAAGGYTTIVDGIVGPWMLHHYRRIAAQHPEVAMHYIALRPDRKTALDRAQQRTSPDALVEAGPIIDLWEQFSDLGDLDHHTVDTTHLSVEDSVESVREALASGRLRLR